MNLRLLILSVGFVLGTLFLNAEEGIVTKNLILDLDAARGVTLADLWPSYSQHETIENALGK